MPVKSSGCARHHLAYAKMCNIKSTGWPSMVYDFGINFQLTILVIFFIIAIFIIYY